MSARLHTQLASLSFERWIAFCSQMRKLRQVAFRSVAHNHYDTLSFVFESWAHCAQRLRLIWHGLLLVLSRLQFNVMFRSFSTWSFAIEINYRHEKAKRLSGLCSLQDSFLAWLNMAKSCSPHPVVKVAESYAASAERIASDCVAAAEFVVSLSETTVLFQNCMLQRTAAAAANGVNSLHSAAEAICWRQKCRVLIYRAFGYWATFCSVRLARAEAWSVCAAADARAALSEAGRAHALTVWAASRNRFSAARKLAAWARWSVATRARRNVGTYLVVRRARKLLKKSLEGLQLSKVNSKAPLLATA